MDGISLIQDLAFVLLCAGIAGVICKRLGLSVVVGYLLAGILLGPYTPPFSWVMDVERIQTMSQIGLVFLMFAIGLGLSLSRLARMGLPTLAATGIGAFLVFNLTQLLGQAVGWTSTQSLFVAAMFMVSSSAVIAKVIGELGLSHKRSAQIALTVTVLEDVVAVAMLTILANQSASGATSETNLSGLLGGLTAFVVLLVGGGLLLVPRVMGRLEKKADPELQTIIVAGLLFILALAAAKAGYSLALGAFLLGAIVAEIPQKPAVENAFSGVRDIFSSVFFVSIGMMIDVRLLVDVWPWIVGLCVFALVARILCAGIALALVGNSPRESRRAALLLTPLGEFSFIIAQTGVQASILPQSFYPIAVGTSILTVLITPIINRNADRILGVIDRLEPARVRRTFEAYHGWLRQIQDRPNAPLVWKLVRGRIVQIGVEALFVSGLLIFSVPLIDLLQPLFPSSWTAHPWSRYIPWSILALIVVIPIFAIWRNISAISMILAEALGSERLAPRVIETLLRALAAFLMAYWLYVVLPVAQLSDWGWLVLVAGAGVLAATFSNRLIYWHSQWQTSVHEVLTTDYAIPARDAERSTNREALVKNLEEWDIHLGDCTVPDDSVHTGQTLGNLSVPQRFGCSIIEADRNGYVIPAPGPMFAIYPGDRLLLLGQPDQIKDAAAFLGASDPNATAAGISDAVLDTITVADSPHADKTLGELQVTKKTGVRIVGIQRGADRITHLVATDRLLNGDRVLVVGSLAQIRQFRTWLKRPAEPVAA